MQEVAVPHPAGVGEGRAWSDDRDVNRSDGQAASDSLCRCLVESYDGPGGPSVAEVSFDYAVNKLFIKETTTTLMFKRFPGLFNQAIGIDLGTANTL
ncbi:MAG: hypothetical protein RL515_635, partial [Verrucomicrobiota bacterium]